MLLVFWEFLCSSHQAGWADDLATFTYALLEIFVEGLRVVTLLFIIGKGNVRGGIQEVKSIFTIPKNERDSSFTRMAHKFKANWMVILREVLFFALAALSMNYLIDWIAGTATVHSLLIQAGLPASNELVLHTAATLFIKNLTVIPLTIVFQYVLVIYLLNPGVLWSSSSDLE